MKIQSLILRAIRDYRLIEAGDRVAVGVSGGKDSLVLLQNLYFINKYIIKDFELYTITIDMGFGNKEDFNKIKSWCEKRQIKYIIKDTNIYDIVFKNRKEKNPCSLCSRMRSASLHDAAVLIGCNKIALGHHMDDVNETFLMNLFNEGRMAVFSPKTWLSRKDVTLIRPLCYANESQVINEVKNGELKVVKSPCPADKKTDRERVKNLLNDLELKNKGIKERIFGAIVRFNLGGWGKKD